jgi:hypothetical protein
MSRMQLEAVNKTVAWDFFGSSIAAKIRHGGAGARLKLVAKPKAYEARSLNRNRQSLVEGWSGEILFLQSLPGVRHIQDIDCRS